jgi:hypothetical protein
VACLLNIASLQKLYEAAWRDGFRQGADHGNIDYKYPPEDIAWLQHKKDYHDLFVCLTRDELKAIQAWEDADYTRRTDEARWRIDDPEEIAAEQSNPSDKPAGSTP